MLETLQPLAADRKCFRMVNGVLVERTVADALPLVQINFEGLKKVLEELLKQYRARQEEMDQWKVRTALLCTDGQRSCLMSRCIQQENKIQVVQS